MLATESYSNDRRAYSIHYPLDLPWSWNVFYMHLRVYFTRGLTSKKHIDYVPPNAPRKYNFVHYPGHPKLRVRFTEILLWSRIWICENNLNFTPILWHPKSRLIAKQCSVLSVVTTPSKSVSRVENKILVPPLCSYIKKLSACVCCFFPVHLLQWFGFQAVILWRIDNTQKGESFMSSTILCICINRMLREYVTGTPTQALGQQNKTRAVA